MQDAGNLGDILRYSLISVIENGQGLRPKKLLETLQKLESSRDQTRHIGLANTHKQLKLTYGEPYGIILRSKFGWGTSVHLTIPKD